MTTHTRLPEHISTDCTQSLKDLLASAERGDIIGLSAAVMMRRGRYFVEIVGAAARDPVLSLGMTFVLADELRAMAADDRTP
ncbi:MAG: hypothetical protein RLZZ373_2638 [Pseudomonadota bacterium]|jgi:hypothetical protein